MAAEDMISEGAPLRQPSKAESKAALVRATRHAWSRQFHEIMTPATAFWTGVVTGLVVSLLSRKFRHSERV